MKHTEETARVVYQLYVNDEPQGLASHDPRTVKLAGIPLDRDDVIIEVETIVEQWKKESEIVPIQDFRPDLHSTAVRILKRRNEDK